MSFVSGFSDFDVGAAKVASRRNCTARGSAFGPEALFIFSKDNRLRASSLVSPRPVDYVEVLRTPHHCAYRYVVGVTMPTWGGSSYLAQRFEGSAGSQEKLPAVPGPPCSFTAKARRSSPTTLLCLKTSTFPLVAIACHPAPID